jgi:His-Xaa-Ser system radical SAM maturase HxsC
MQSLEKLQIGRVRHIGTKSITITIKSILAKQKLTNVKGLNGVTIGDIVHIDANNDIHSLWRASSKDNIIFATNACNEKCKYCPQPSEGNVYSNASINAALISNLRHNEIKFVTITGGEPTLIGTGLSNIIKAILDKNKNASISILTNGMEFDNATFADEVVKAGKLRTRICVALHSDVPSIHDSITGVIGSFDRTALGLLNLQRSSADIEIRIVLNRLNVKRLENMALIIGMNFPFVAHVAFMGLEMHAVAAANAEAIWINPPEYMQDLSIALNILKCRGIQASIYNLPYCLVSSTLWPYLRDSISSWKKIYLPVCISCTKKPSCPGLFATSTFQSPSIAPI